MKNAIVKRIMMAALTGTLCLSSASVAYAANAGTGAEGKQMQLEAAEGERPAPPEGAAEGERPALPEGAAEGERPALPEGAAEGERPALPEGAAEGERPAPPEGAAEGERPAPPEGAAKGGLSEKPEGEQMELPEDSLNIMAYKDALEGIEDEDTKASLQEYINAAEDALKAEKEALDENPDLSEEEISAYRDAVSEAEAALAAAFSEAGIEVDEELPEVMEGKEDELPEGVAGNRPLKEDDNLQAALETASSENVRTESAARPTEEESGNIVTKKLSEIYSFLKGLFKQE